MNIKITRHRKTPEVIDGHLAIDGSLKLCDTAENTLTALPAGTYPVTIVKCKQYARKMPIIKIGDCCRCEKLACVTNNSKMPQVCHMLKVGNGVYHRADGSIILGTFIAPGCLMHSKEAFDSVYDRIRKSAERGHEITLTIEEHYPIARRELTNYELGQLLVGEHVEPKQM